MTQLVLTRKRADGTWAVYTDKPTQTGVPLALIAEHYKIHGEFLSWHFTLQLIALGEKIARMKASDVIP